MIGYAIEASDGPVGNVIDILIDDQTWSLARIIVDTRERLPGRQLAVPAAAIDGVDPEARRVRLRIARGEIERSPPV